MRLGAEHHWQSLRQLLDAQDRRCAYTGEPILLGINDSLDHILPRGRFPALAHDPTNVEWVTREINQMKRDRTHDEFISLIGHILAYRLKAGSD